MKKYSKMLAVFLCAFFIGITPSFARVMTEEELEKEINEVNPEADYIYIIGEYVFTSTHKLTREDSMLAGRSIQVEDVDGKTNKDKIYSEMAIYRYRLDMDEDYNQINFYYDSNMIGTKAHPTTYDIKYIDYEYVGLPTDATISANVDADKEALKNIYGYDVTKGKTNVTLKDNKLTGSISRDDADGELFSSIPEDRTGYYYPINIKVPGATDKTTITYGKKKTTVKSSDLTILYALNPNAEKKVIEIYVDLDGDEKEYKNTRYVIDYSGLEFLPEVNVSTQDELLAAIANKVEKIVLKQNVELTNSLELATADKVEIDLNGKELTLKNAINSQGELTISNGKITADRHAIIADGGKVTLNDVEIAAVGYGVSVENKAEVTVNGGKLVSSGNTAIALFDDSVTTLNGTELSGKLGGVGANATRPYKKLEVIESTIKSVGEPAIFFPGSSVDGKTAELVVTKSTLEGISGIDARSGKITITDSTITALGTDENWEYVKNHDDASGTTDGAAALYLHSQSPYGNGDTLTVDITNTALTNKNNTKGVIRIYEHAAAGVATITVNTDKEYTIENELREDSRVILVVKSTAVTE